MWYCELIQNIKERYGNLKTSLENITIQSLQMRSDVYHIIIHDSTYKEFWEKVKKEDVVVYDYRRYYHYGVNHSHFLVYSKEPFKTSRRIISNPINGETYEKNIFSSSDSRHFLCCLNFSNLQDRCIRVILDKINSLLKLHELNIPKRLEKKIFQDGRYYNIFIPDKKFSFFDEIADIKTEMSPRFLIRFYFVTNNFEICELCLNCMISKTKNGNFCRVFELFYMTNSSIRCFVRRTFDKCIACDEQHLFHILTKTQVYKKYYFNPRNYCSDKYCNCQRDKVIIRKDFFENGNKITSLYGCKIKVRQDLFLKVTRKEIYEKYYVHPKNICGDNCCHCQTDKVITKEDFSENDIEITDFDGTVPRIWEWYLLNNKKESHSF